MIEKDAGNLQIERLLIIHLFEVDYNLSLKLLWGKRMVYQGKDNNCFGKQQHGSRPLHQATNPVHLKTLTYDLTRILCTSLIMFDNNATGCFDCIIVSLAMIAALWLGMPCPAAQMHSSVLLHMKYFIKMAHGILDAFYHVLQDYLLYCTGQGSGASPSVWLSLVVVLLTALTVLSPLAMSFIDPWEDIQEERNADSFVDDTSNGCNDAHLEEPMPYAELIAMAQACAQIWEQLLFSSGGALELKKCFWYLIYWQWVNGHLQMTTISGCPGIIALTCGTVPNYTVIPRLEVWEAQRTLGVCRAPDGNYQKEAEFLLFKANCYAVWLFTLHLSEMDTFIFHQSTYIPLMMYSLPVTMIDVAILNKIQQQAIHAILNKLGVSKPFLVKLPSGPRICVAWP